MKTIYADFNNFEADGTLNLSYVGSVESIAKLSEPLVEGEEVCFTDGELRTTGRVYRHADGAWEARGEFVFES